MAATLKIRIDQGTLWRRRLRLRTGTAESNTPLDLTGYELKAEVRLDPKAAAAIPMAIENADLAVGEFDLVLDDRARALPAAHLRWDLLATAPDGTVAKYLDGPVELLGTITRLP